MLIVLLLILSMVHGDTNNLKTEKEKISSIILGDFVKWEDNVFYLNNNIIHNIKNFSDENANKYVNKFFDDTDREVKLISEDGEAVFCGIDYREGDIKNFLIGIAAYGDMKPGIPYCLVIHEKSPWKIKQPITVVKPFPQNVTLYDNEKKIIMDANPLEVRNSLLLPFEETMIALGIKYQ